MVLNHIFWGKLRPAALRRGSRRTAHGRDVGSSPAPAAAGRGWPRCAPRARQTTRASRGFLAFLFYSLRPKRRRCDSNQSIPGRAISQAIGISGRRAPPRPASEPASFPERGAGRAHVRVGVRRRPGPGRTPRASTATECVLQGRNLHSARGRWLQPTKAYLPSFHMADAAFLAGRVVRRPQ